MAADTYDALATVLSELPGRFGPTVFADRRRVVSMLSDRVPEARREIKVLGSALDDGVFDALSNARPEQIGLEIDRLAARIETNLGIRSDIALPVIRACAYGLGRGPLPSQYGAAPAHGAAPMPSQPDGSWVGGVSAPVGASQPGATPVPRYTPDGSWVGVSAPVGAPGGPPAYGAPPPQYGASTGPYPPQQGGWGSSGPGMAPHASYPYPGAGPVAAKGGGWVKWVLIGVGALVAILVVLYIIGSNTPTPTPTPTPPTPPTRTDPPPRTTPTKPDDPSGPVITKPQREATKPTDPPAPTPPAPTPPAPTPPGPTGSFAEEASDFGVAPQRMLQSNVGSPTPTSIPVGRLLSTQMLNAEIQKGTDFLLVDVLEGAHQRTLVKARYIPYGGRGGTFNDQVQQQLTSDLAGMTGNRPNYPIVFFCQGVRCWESYNAVLRAYEAGYRNLYWYRGGIAAWTAAGLPTQPLGGGR